MRKKKIFRSVLVFSILPLLLFLSCDKKSSSGTEDLLSNIVGTWTANTLTATITVTTNIVQEAFNFFEPANGTMTLTGQYSADFNYLFYQTSNWGTFTQITHR